MATVAALAALKTHGHFHAWSRDPKLINTFFLAKYRKGDLVTSDKGKELQKKVWKEIVRVLRKHVPQDGQAYPI